jgi:predicted ArsR family transcriptional regulator
MTGRWSTMSRDHEPVRPEINATQDNQELGAVSLLLAPLRWRLYQYIHGAGEAVGRDEAAAAAGISRNLAAFHLDRMAEAGLLTVEYRRLTGRSGRGAGRPAKLYRAAAQRIVVSLSATRYPLAGGILATAVDEKGADEDGVAVVRRVAVRVGAELGPKLRRPVGADGDPLGLAELAVRELGYDPERDRGWLVLRNCPFAELAASHRELICQMSHALLTGLLPGLGAEGVSAAGPRPSEQPGFCCVIITQARAG